MKTEGIMQPSLTDLSGKQELNILEIDTGIYTEVDVR